MLWQDRFLHTKSQLLLALQRYQLDHQNQLPLSLDHLLPEYVPAVPPDPYNGQALHYDAANRRIWSVGKNLTDDGGNSHPDLTFDYLNPTIYIPPTR